MSGGESHPFRGASLESLKGEAGALSFFYFELAGIDMCDVDYYVGTPQRNYGGLIGIDVLANANKLERKPMVNFLKNKWKKFDYEF